MTPAQRNSLTAVLALCSFVCCAQAQTGSSSSSVNYSVSLAGFHEHILHIQCEIPPGSAVQTVQLPAWNALYQVRDFAQYINWMRARDRAGAPLPVHELDKSSWRVEGAAQGAILEYELFADSPGPYGAQINGQHAFLNLAEILAYPVENRGQPMRVRFTDVPAGWKFATSLAQSNETFEAPDYDRLVDAPVEIGTFRESDFDKDGATYRVVVDANPSDYDMDRIVGDLSKIVTAACSWMNDRPYASYVFLYHFPHISGGGGMEHAFSTAIDLNADALAESSTPLLDVSAHEFFHLWNVKRIRPQSLEPIDYTKENYTTALWFSEGVTSTVGDTILLRAGLMNEANFLQRLGAQITELEERPAHRVQSAEDSSLNAWLEKYSYYREPERSISYYNKGDLLGVLLDLLVRENSRGQASLREVFQWMNQHYAKQGKFFADSPGVRQAAEAVGGGDLGPFFTNYVAGTNDIPWNDFFRTVGLVADRRAVVVVDPGFSASRNFDAAPTVLSVKKDSDAAQAGLVAGDSIVELNGRPAASDFERRLAALRPGDNLRLRVRNRRGDRDLQWRLAGREESVWEVKGLDYATAEQLVRRTYWLKGEAQPAGEAHP